MSPSFPLYLALALYGAGTLTALLSLQLRPADRLQRAAALVMGLGWLAHTVWIGTICSQTGHPPITNLPESVSFIAWTILGVQLVLWLKYRIEGAAFFIYPLVFLLLSLAAIVHEQFRPLDPELRSNLFIAHLLLSSVGVAALLIGVGFTVLYQMQERAIRSKKRGALWNWVPSLRVCDLVSYRALSIGFAIYTLGILAGVIWSYRSSESVLTPGVKEIGAFVAWLMFAALLQSYIAGSYRTRKTLVIAAVAFVSILVSIFGIQHV